MRGQKYEEAKDVTALVLDDGWVLEQKLDGVRTMVHVLDGVVHFRGPMDEAITFAAAAQWFEALRPALERLPHGAVLDAELLIETGELWAFDLPYLPGWIKPTDELAQRRNILEHLIPLMDSPLVRLVPQAVGTDEKVALLKAVEAAGAEGVVLKRLAAGYQVGQRTRNVLKHKFVKTMDVVITGRDNGGKNAELSLVRDGELVVIGACSMIGKPDLQVGDVAEVAYLYLADPNDPRLYQPRLMRERPDKRPSECEWRQTEGNFTSREVVTL
jgi:bifunctional non-homologous end joining protein LigD